MGDDGGASVVENPKAIEAFWRWWEKEHDGLEASLGSQSMDALAPYIEAISQRVHAIHPDLQWELGRPEMVASDQPQTGRYVMCVTGAGNLTLRVLAERWRVAAPPQEGWSFFAARQPYHRQDSGQLRLGGHHLDREELQVTLDLDRSREQLNIQIGHPQFAQMSEAARTRAAFLLLDTWFGEDDAIRWIGSVTIAEGELDDDPLPWQALEAAIAQLKADATGSRWALMRGKDAQGGLMLAFINLALKPLDHLLMDLLVEVHLDFDVEEDWLPKAVSEDLEAMEEELRTELGHQAVYIGRLTRTGRRTLLFHLSGLDNTLEQLEAWATRPHPLHITLEARHDPTWEGLRRW
ncbi:MAG: DUF695 domain-containing protein [Myxococcota bacterium]